MSITARILIWVSLLFCFLGFTGRSNACAVLKQVHAHHQQIHLSKAGVSHHEHISSRTEDICIQDADEVDTDDHNDEVFVHPVLNYVVACFLQQHPRTEFLPAPPENPAFSLTIPRYILFHSLVIPPAA